MPAKAVRATIDKLFVKAILVIEIKKSSLRGVETMGQLLVENDENPRESEDKL